MMAHKPTIRDWQESDMVQLAELHRKMDVGYNLPESFGPLYFIRKAVVDQDGKLVAAVTVKLVGEAFLWVDPELPTYERAKSVKMLSDECSEIARTHGLEEVSCWIPPRIAECFAKVIEKLGWKKSPWSNWSRLL